MMYKRQIVCGVFLVVLLSLFLIVPVRAQAYDAGDEDYILRIKNRENGIKATIWSL